MNVWASVRRPAILAVAMGVVAAGCSVFHPSTLTPTGNIVRSHSKPIDNGYYMDWDPLATSLKLDRVQDTTPVGTNQIYVATVADSSGKPLGGRRVEWMIADGGVGDIIEVDETGLSNGRGYKVNNHYAVSHTNFFDHLLDRGTDDPSDDVFVQAGQTWIAVTSPVEGQTHLTAFAPAVYNWEEHRVLARHNWFDVAWEIPSAGTDPVGGSRTFTTRVFKHSDGTPLVNYKVQYQMMGGPAGSFNHGYGEFAEVLTDSNGIATAILSQNTPREGVNDVMVTIIRPEQIGCCKPEVKIVDAMTLENWIGPDIRMTKSAPHQATCGDTFTWTIDVLNMSQFTAQDVLVSDTIPSGLSYVSSTPNATMSGGSLTWNLGSMAQGEQQTLSVTMQADPSGTFGSQASLTAALGVSLNDFAETHVTCPALALTFDAPQKVSACDPIHYTITVRNTGDGPAHNVEISEHIASGLRVASGHSMRNHQIGTLAQGQAKQVSFMVEPTQTGSFVNSATATATGGLTAEASAETIVEQARLSITKSGPDERYVGTNATYENATRRPRSQSPPPRHPPIRAVPIEIGMRKR